MKSIIQNKDEIIGDIIYLHDFYSIHLQNERDIVIWLPSSYSTSNKYFPVLYMHDGQNLFNPGTSFTGYDWKIDEIVSGLIKNELMEEIIIVAINNTKNRLKEYNYFSDEGKLYAAFLIKEVKRHVDENFRTSKGKLNNAVMGSSLGGLFSFQLFWNYPNIFGKAACMSNSFGVNDREIFKTVKNNPFFNIDNKLYIDCGESEKLLINDNKRMCVLLKRLKYFTNGNFYCEFFKDAKHSEYDWAERVHIPLIFLYGTENGKRKYLDKKVKTSSAS